MAQVGKGSEGRAKKEKKETKVDKKSAEDVVLLELSHNVEKSSEGDTMRGAKDGEGSGGSSNSSSSSSRSSSGKDGEETGSVGRGERSESAASGASTRHFIGDDVRQMPARFILLLLRLFTSITSVDSNTEWFTRRLEITG